MPNQEVTSSELGAHPATIVDRVRYERSRIVITRNGRPCVAMVTVEDLVQLERAAVDPPSEKKGMNR